MIVIITQLITIDNCYTIQTQFKIQALLNVVSLHLYPTGDVQCNSFPPGVIFELRFSDSTLDIQTTLINFTTNTDLIVTFQVGQVSDYFGIQAVSFYLKSYSHVYFQQVQEVTLTRSDSSYVIERVNKSEYDDKLLHFEVILNPVIVEPVTNVAFTICIVNCQTFYQNIITTLESTISFNISMPDFSDRISLFGIQSQLLTIYYGDLVQDSAETDQFLISESYLTPIGVITDAFLYSDGVFVHIKVDTNFKKFAQTFQYVNMNFKFSTCSYNLIMPIDQFLSDDDDISLFLNQNQFLDKSTFLQCAIQSYAENSAIILGINLVNRGHMARYILMAETGRTCFFDSIFSLNNNIMKLYSKVVQDCELKTGNYTLLIQGYISLEHQLEDNYQVLLTKNIFFNASDTEFKVNFLKNQQLIEKMQKMYSTSFLLLLKGEAEDDCFMQILISLNDEYYFFMSLQMAIVMIITVVVCFIQFSLKYKCLKTYQKVKNINSDDML
ncbi:hypothetical protein SS50377_20682 [Spironucleus salmonicida]|uniref:Transmembrane protein n=1 Tax=Spironucleus salmonicida TaxID=348837 RepID=V6M0G1_9EUKA|nr:hypothetical protein SS50377_20682 [Spironucleus salmonicida]|eukprot:EST49531.1 Hypothetical protein SS50377_10135 [Spironucleus salmonicida]